MNNNKRITRALICALIFISAYASQAAVFDIPNGDVLALKAALITANSNGQADTINLASGGTYTLTTVDNSVTGPTGLPPISNDVAGLDLTINGNGAKVQRSAAVGTPEFRILAVSDGASLSCLGLTIANGKLSGANNVPATSGAGIYASGATVGLTNCTLRNNSARAGGAVYKALGAFTADASVITTNTGVTGGGIFSTGGTVALSHCDVTENAVPAGQFGGAIRIETGQLTVTDSRLNLNTGGNGGAVANFGSATVLRSELSDNLTSAGGGGGAIFNGNTVSVESSTMHGNRAGTGGAVYNSSGITTLRDSTLSNNGATGSGGALSHATGTMSLLGCTLSRNTAGRGGALANISGSVQVRCATFALNSGSSGAGGIHNGSAGGAPGQVTLLNSILQQGASGANLVNENGNIISEGSNLSSDAAGGNSGTGPGGFLNERSDIRNTNANLGPLQNNGGPTLTHVPIASSPAIDAGDDFVLSPPLTLTSDQRGAGFSRLRGTHVDIGAVESGLNLIVTTIDDHDDGTCTMADCTLREAIAAANGAGSGNISFAPGLGGTIQLGSALPDVGVNLVVVGPGPRQLEVRRNTGGDYRILTVSNGASSGPSVSIVGLKFSNGQAPSGAFPVSSGGGILNDRATLQLTNCIISSNSSFLGGQTYGGGIFNHQGRLFVSGSTIVGNASYYGGGVANLRSVPGFSDLHVSNSTISGNTSAGGFGGGIFSQAENQDSTVELRMTNCTISGNDAGTSFFAAIGGGIFTAGRLSASSLADIADCTFSGNNASSGGSIYNLNFSASALVNLRNCILKNGTRGENLLNSSGTIVSLGHNLSNDDAAGFGGTGPGGYLNATGDVRNTGPLLGPLQDNGGGTFTHALLTGSPAINTGEDTSDAESDQRGFAQVGTNDIGAFEFDAAPPPVELLSAHSRKTHGAAGAFDIDLQLNDPIGVESRSGGPNGNHTVVLTFSNPLVSLGGASVSAGTGVVALSEIDASDPHQCVVHLAGVANAQRITITLANVTDSLGNSSTVSARMDVLLGDSNGDRTVNSGDAQQTRNRSGQTTGATNFRSDNNLDGTINGGDALVVRARSGSGIED